MYMSDIYIYNHDCNDAIVAVRYKGIVAVMIINRLLIQTALPATGERGCGILTV